MNTLILQPRLSEKAMAQAEQRTYLFNVPRKANKLGVKQAVEAQFKVKVETVNLLIRKGRLKRVKKTVGRTPDSKVAYVKLIKGQTIKLFETGEKK